MIPYLEIRNSNCFNKTRGCSCHVDAIKILRPFEFTKHFLVLLLSLRIDEMHKGPFVASLTFHDWMDLVTKKSDFLTCETTMIKINRFLVSPLFNNFFEKLFHCNSTRVNPFSFEVLSLLCSSIYQINILLLLQSIFVWISLSLLDSESSPSSRDIPVLIYRLSEGELLLHSFYLWSFNSFGELQHWVLFIRFRLLMFLHYWKQLPNVFQKHLYEWIFVTLPESVICLTKNWCCLSTAVPEESVCFHKSLVRIYQKESLDLLLQHIMTLYSGRIIWIVRVKRPRSLINSIAVAFRFLNRFKHLSFLRLIFSFGNDRIIFWKMVILPRNSISWIGIIINFFGSIIKPRNMNHEHKLWKDWRLSLPPTDTYPLNMSSLCEKCANTEFFLVRIFLHLNWIWENTEQKKLRIWTLFTHCGRRLFVRRNKATAILSIFLNIHGTGPNSKKEEAYEVG